MISLLAFRALPFVVYALLGSRLGFGSRASWVAGFACFAAIAIRNDAMMAGEIVSIVAPLAYFALLGLVIHGHAPRRALESASSLLLFAQLAIACLVLPAVVLRSTPVLLPTLVLGWEVMLSGYSYCFDVTATETAPSRADCLFFLLVNPALVYAERGTPERGPARTAIAASRCLLGIAALAGQDVLVGMMGSDAVARPLEVFGIRSAQDYLHVLIRYLGRFGAYYFAQSGLSSFRIGLAALVGYAVPECYRHPYLSTSPQDFWRRWNLWVGRWARRYLFFPTSLVLRRKFRPISMNVVLVVAVMATFLGVGLLHDLVKCCLDLSRPIPDWPPPKGIVLFGLSGVTLLLWASGERWLPRRDGSGIFARAGGLLTIGKMLVFFHLLFLVHATTLWLLPRAVAQPGGW